MLLLGCTRVKTNVCLESVRINGIKYNSSDLESKLYVPDRNNLIVDTYLEEELLMFNINEYVKMITE